MRKYLPGITLFLAAIAGIAGAQVLHDDAAHGHGHGHSNELVGIGHDTTLAAGHEADSVVSILGVTRILGHDRGDAVAILGDTIVEDKVDGDAVALLGDIDLGSNAEIDGDVVTILGEVRRDPAAVVHGGVHSIFDRERGAIGWLSAWIKNCLLYARPLAFDPGLAWAWGIALAFLAMYALLALLAPGAVRRCVQTFDAYPGHALLAAFIGMLLTPVVFVLLAITLLGIPAIPFVATGLLCMGLMGRAVMLAWIGTRLLGGRGGESAGIAPLTALTVLIGGAVVLALYVVPILGFLAFQLLGILGFGTVVYTIVRAVREHRNASVSPQTARPESRPSSAPLPGTAPPEAPPPQTTPAATAPAAEVLPVSPDLPRAGFWIRMAALFLDALLIGFVTGVLHHAFNLHLLLLAIYGAVMWKLRGATLGGIIFDLQVARLDGRPMNWETAIVRALGCFLSLVVAGLGFVWIAFDASKQAWHDKIAGTVVVRVAKAVPSAQPS